VHESASKAVKAVRYLAAELPLVFGYEILLCGWRIVFEMFEMMCGCVVKWLPTRQNNNKMEEFS
jgi:hypothetical protein